MTMNASKTVFISTFFLLTCVAVSQPARFDTLIRDFGELGQRDVRTAVFTLYNTGPEALQLTEPKAGCGCTAVLLDRSEVQPGDSVKIEVEFHSGPNMLGEVVKTIRIGHMHLGRERELATLRVRAEVVGELRFEPTLLSFRSAIGDTVRFRVNLRSNSEQTVEVLSMEPSLTAFVDDSEGNTYRADHVTPMPFEDVSLQTTASKVEAGGEADLDIVFAPKHKGQINGIIRIGLSRSEIRIPVTGVVLRTRH
jgi:hypothetical protein